jgi:hypothetical protein
VGIYARRLLFGGQKAGAKAIRNNSEAISERRNGHGLAANASVVVVNNYESDRDGLEGVPKVIGGQE